jgi:flavin-dependent dehydrogenase
VSAWDLVIVGGGPVGLVTAIAARRRGLRAVVVERSPVLPEKACGEGLMPGAVAVLGELGVDLDGAVELRGIRFLDGQAEASARFPGLTGRAMSRARLMHALAERARAVGVELCLGHTLRDFEYRGRVMHVRVQAAGGGVIELAAELLVAADGLRSGVRRRLGYELPALRQPRFGLQRHYRCAPWTDWVEVHWHDHAEAYVTPLGRDQVGVALLSHGAPAAYEDLLGLFPQLGRALGSSSAGRVRGAGPFEQRVRAVLAPGVALVGDASGYLDAVSGEGLALGFRCSLALIERFTTGKLWRYPDDHSRLGATYNGMTRLLLEIARRPWLRRWAIRFLAARPALFSDLLGVASGSTPAAASAVGAALRWATALPVGE